MLKASIVGFYNLSENIENTWEIIEKLSEWGYKAYESGDFLLHGDAESNINKLCAFDFQVLAVSADLESLRNNIAGIIEKAQTVGVKYVCCYWSDPQDYEQAVENAEILDMAGETLRSENIILCYHNHDHEFKRSFNGVKYFDILMSMASPENLSVNLDVGWASLAGENVPELIRRLNCRIKLMHFKDFYDFDDRTSFTALGTGKVAVRDLLAEADKIGLEYISVEQDALRNLNCDDTVLLSYLTLKESGFVE